MSKAGQSLLKGLQEARAHHQGKETRAREHKFSAADVARIRFSMMQPTWKNGPKRSK